MPLSFLQVDPEIPESYGTYTFRLTGTYESASQATQMTLYFAVVLISAQTASGITPFAVQQVTIPLNTDLGTLINPIGASVHIVADAVVEADETYAIVVLPSATSNPLTDYLVRSVFTIVDDDAYSTLDDYRDAFNDNTATMGQLNPGQARSGNVEAPADVDTFLVTLTAGTTYSIAVEGAATGLGTLYDPYVNLYNDNGTLLAHDDDSGAGNNSLLSFTPNTTGKYYIAASGYRSAETGTYQVSVTAGGSGANDDFGGDNHTQGQIAVGATIGGNVETAGDKDWLRVSLLANTTYTMALKGVATGSGTLYDPFVSLYTTSGVFVASNDDDGVGANSLLTFTTTAASAYYVEARSFAAGGTGTYQLSVTANAAASGGTDDYGNDNTSTGNITTGQTISGNVESAGDKDWFHVSLAANTSYTIALNGAATASGTLYDPYVSLYTSAGVLIASNDDDGAGSNSLLHFTPSVAGGYYIEARSFSASATGTYQVTFTADGSGSSGNDDYAGDNTTSGTIAAGQTISGNVESAADKDWFHVTLTAGTAYTFGLNGQVTASGTLYDPFMSLYTSAGVLLASDDDSGIGNNSLLQFVPGTSGGYYIEARSFSTSATGTYELVMSSGLGSGGVDDYAASTSTSGLLALGEAHAGNVESAGDKDWFAVTLAAGNSYFIAMNGQTNAAGTLYDPLVALYNSAGVLIASDDDGGIGNNSLLQYAATDGGTYYVEARGFNPTATGTYHVEVDLIGVTGA